MSDEDVNAEQEDKVEDLKEVAETEDGCDPGTEERAQQLVNLSVQPNSDKTTIDVVGTMNSSSGIEISVESDFVEKNNKENDSL